MAQKSMQAFVFFTIVVLWDYFSSPYEVLQAGKGNEVRYALTPNAKAYMLNYGVTILLTFCVVCIGLVFGFILALIRFSPLGVLNFIVDEFIDIIRGTPVILQLMISAFVIFTFLDSLHAAILALGLNSSAYIAGIVRSGINSVDKGQMEAARAMGLDYQSTMREIILPQALKNILPAPANKFISLFKETSVVGLIGVVDITMQSRSLQAVLYSPKPIIFTGLVYHVSAKVSSLGVRLLERRLNKND